MINTPVDLPLNFPLRCRLEVDAFSDARFLGDETRLKEALQKVADIAGMDLIKFVITPIALDHTKLTGDEFQDDGGVSVQGLITTSHITLHAWPNRQCFFFDLVSCKYFNRKDVTNAVCDLLEVRTVIYESFVDVADLHRQLHSGGTHDRPPCTF